jgi:hypothetical protein
MSSTILFKAEVEVMRSFDHFILIASEKPILIILILRFFCMICIIEGICLLVAFCGILVDFGLLVRGLDV